MKLRSFFFALAAVSLVLLLISVGSLYWLLSQSPLTLRGGGITAHPTAAMFVPKQAPLMGSILVNPDRMEAYRQLRANPGERRRSRRELQRLKKSLLNNTGLDYRQDIQPWLGQEITLAVTSLDFDRNQENGAQPGYLLAATAQDAELAREFLQSYFSQQAATGTSDLVFEQYKGVNLIYRHSLTSCGEKKPCPPSISSAVVGNFVLFANHPKVLRDAINNVQVPDLNLQNSSSYQQTRQTIEQPRIGEAFVNIPAVTAWLADEPASEIPEQRLTLALSLDPQGLRSETALLGVEGDESNRKPALSEPVEALQYTPASSILTAAGVNLNQLWTKISAGLEGDHSLARLLQQSRHNFQNRFGIDLPEEIFSWVEGEYALSLLPSRDWVFVAEKGAEEQRSRGAEELQEQTASEQPIKRERQFASAKNKPQSVDAAIERLDNYAKQGGLSVGNLSLAGETITAWTELRTASDAVAGGNTRLDAQVKGVHTNVGKYEIFTTSIGAMAQALKGSPDSLVESEKFQEAIAPLPTENDGSIYIDWKQTQPIWEEQFRALRFVEVTGNPLLDQRSEQVPSSYGGVISDHLRSLAISSHGTENGIPRATVFFQLEGTGKQAN